MKDTLLTTLGTGDLSLLIKMNIFLESKNILLPIQVLVIVYFCFLRGVIHLAWFIILEWWLLFSGTHPFYEKPSATHWESIRGGSWGLLAPPAIDKD